MLRTLMQVYVKGSVEAVALYQKAFDAVLMSDYRNDDGSFYHSELEIGNQILAVAEASYAGAFAQKDRMSGNIMQFCLHFREEELDLLKKAYELLRIEGQILVPLGACDYSACMTDFIDKFGVRWCMFI